MKLKPILPIVIIIFLFAGFSGCIEQSKIIEKSVSIPHYGSTLQAEGVGSAGTLYCKGTIIETTSGVESIRFEWKADVTFPGDGVAGWFEWGDIFESRFWPGTMAPSPTLQQKWCNAEGEYHIWKVILMIYPDSAEANAYVDGVEIYAESTTLVGFNDMKQGSHEVYSAFASESICTGKSIFDMDRYLETEKFKIVKSGDNFWFE